MSKFIETENRSEVTKELRRGRIGSHSIMTTEFLFGMIFFKSHGNG